MEIFKEDIPEGERMGEYEIEGFHVNVKEFLDKMKAKGPGRTDE
jgi:hypothetical protein